MQPTPRSGSTPARRGPPTAPPGNPKAIPVTTNRMVPNSRGCNIATFLSLAVMSAGSSRASGFGRDHAPADAVEQRRQRRDVVGHRRPRGPLAFLEPPDPRFQIGHVRASAQGAEAGTAPQSTAPPPVRPRPAPAGLLKRAGPRRSPAPGRVDSGPRRFRRIPAPPACPPVQRHLRLRDPVRPIRAYAQRVQQRKEDAAPAGRAVDDSGGAAQHPRRGRRRFRFVSGPLVSHNFGDSRPTSAAVGGREGWKDRVATAS